MMWRWVFSKILGFYTKSVKSEEKRDEQPEDQELTPIELHLKKLKDIRERENLVLYVYHGYAFPKDIEKHVDYMLYAFKPFMIPNQDKPKIVLSLAKLSRLWLERRNNRTYEEKSKEEMMNMLAKGLQSLGERLDSLRIAELARMSAEEVLKRTQQISSEEPEELKIAQETMIDISALERAETFSQFMENFREVFKGKNITPQSIDELLEGKEIFDMLRQKFPKYLSKPNYLMAVLFSILALEKFGDRVPSVVSYEATEPGFINKFLRAKGKIKWLEKITLKIHVYNMFFYAYNRVLAEMQMVGLQPWEAFDILICVLLHDIGKIPAYLREVEEEHQSLSANIAEKFLQLPRDIVEAVRKHHSFLKLEDTSLLLRYLVSFDSTERSMEFYVLSGEGLQGIDGVYNFSEKDVEYLRSKLSTAADEYMDEIKTSGEETAAKEETVETKEEKEVKEKRKRRFKKVPLRIQKL